MAPRPITRSSTWDPVQPPASFSQGVGGKPVEVFPDRVEKHPGVKTHTPSVASSPITAQKMSDQELEELFDKMLDILAQIEDLKENGIGEISYERILIEILKDQIRETEDQANHSRAIITSQFAEVNAAREKKRELSKKLLEYSKQGDLFSTFDKLATLFGVVGTGLTAASSGSLTAPLAIALALNVGLGVDQVMKDSIKQKIATFLGGGSSTKESSWLERLRLGAGVLSLALSGAIGYQTAGKKGMRNLFTKAIAAIQSANIVAQAVTNRRSEMGRAGYTEADEELKRLEKQLKDNIDTLEEIGEEIIQAYREMIQSEEKRHQIILASMR